MKSATREALEQRASELGYDADEDDTDEDLMLVIRQRQQQAA